MTVGCTNSIEWKPLKQILARTGLRPHALLRSVLEQVLDEVNLNSIPIPDPAIGPEFYEERLKDISVEKDVMNEVQKVVAALGDLGMLEQYYATWKPLWAKLSPNS